MQRKNSVVARRTGSRVKNSGGSRPGSRYIHVKHTVNSGKSASKVEVLGNRIVSKLKGELFQRINSEDLEKLIQARSEKENGTDREIIEFRYSTLPSGKFPKFGEENNGEVKEVVCDEFVVMDFRDHEMHMEFHIKEAVSFPAFNITRDRMHPRIFNLKNQEGKIIVVYTNDERTGVEVAQQLALRNYYNVYLLSGGISEFAVKFPQLISGIPPRLSKLIPSVKHTKARR